jgi:catechol 2,3-dioxygenase-like lactoylglutathione lyase family enzyme
MKNRSLCRSIAAVRIGLVVAAIAVAGVFPAAGQQAPELVFNHLAISVKDADASAKFYGGVLNLHELTNRAATNGVRWFSLGEGKELHLISHQYYNGTPVAVNRAVHLALTTSDFDGVLKLLDAHQVPYGDFKGNTKQVQTRGDGVKQIYFEDPDGYWIEINSVGKK